MLLRYFDRAGIEADFDHGSGALHLRPATDLRRLLRDAQGVFTILSGAVLILETTPAVVILRVGQRSGELNDLGVEVSGNEGSRTLEITWPNGHIDRFCYAATGWIDNDPTPSVEREDFDFGLFLRNVRNDPGRQLRMSGLSDD